MTLTHSIVSQISCYLIMKPIMMNLYTLSNLFLFNHTIWNIIADTFIPIINKTLGNYFPFQILKRKLASGYDLSLPGLDLSVEELLFLNNAQVKLSSKNNALLRLQSIRLPQDSNFDI